MDKSERYVYKVDRIEKVTDGDTYWLHLDVGFHQTQLTCIRLAGFDTPERHKGDAEEKAAAKRATEVATEFLSEAIEAGTLWVRTEPDPDNFGRWLGHVYTDVNDGPAEVKRTWLGDHLRRRDLASEWPTRWRSEYQSHPEASER